MKNSSKIIKNESVLCIAKTLGELSLKWLKTSDPHRLRAVKRLVDRSGYTPKMAHAALDATFQELTESKLIRFLRSEIGDPLYLDGFLLNKKNGSLSYASGPKAILHIFSSNTPNASIWSLVMGLLVKSDNILKVSKQDSGVLEIYSETLKNFAPKLSRRIKFISSHHSAVKPYLKTAQVIVCYGSDETIKRVRTDSSPDALFVGYGHRISFAVVLKEMLTEKNVSGLVKNLAVDTWMVDGRGCLTPAAIYAQSRGEVSPRKFEQLYRQELDRLYRDGVANYKASSQHILSTLKARVCEFNSIETVIRSFKPKKAYVQAVALEANAKDRQSIVRKLVDLGFNRICRAGQMQYPPITWHHDGRSNIASWLTWTDLK